MSTVQNIETETVMLQTPRLSLLLTAVKYIMSKINLGILKLILQLLLRLKPRDATVTISLTHTHTNMHASTHR